MPINTHIKDDGDASMAFAYRKDGSIRQVLVQDSNNVVIGRGYFPPGTFRDDPNWIQKRKYHWIDAFTDEELLTDEYIFTEATLRAKREEAIMANLEKQFVIESIESYKRK